jgi:hypothetical protein
LSSVPLIAAPRWRSNGLDRLRGRAPGSDCGRRVERSRVATGVLRPRFGERITPSGFARSHMSRIERGKGNPSLDAIEALAAALKVPVAALLQEWRKNAPERILASGRSDGTPPPIAE